MSETFLNENEMPRHAGKDCGNGVNIPDPTVLTIPVNPESLCAIEAPNCMIYECPDKEFYRPYLREADYHAFRKTGLNNMQAMNHLYKVERLVKITFPSLATTTNRGLMSMTYKGLLTQTEIDRLFEYVRINLSNIINGNGFLRDKWVFFLSTDPADITALPNTVVPYNNGRGMQGSAMYYKSEFFAAPEPGSNIVVLRKLSK